MQRIQLALFAGLLAIPGLRAAQPDHSKVPGVVVDHAPARSGLYLGSPGLVRVSDGVYLAKSDEYGPSSSEYERAVTRVYRSEDRGRSWKALTRVEGLYWASLFVHQEAVYMLGTERNQGKVVIVRSTDGGQTWTVPVDAQSGLLLDEPDYHCAPVPVVVHAGRLWRAMEDVRGPGEGVRHFRAFMMSAPVEADLLQASRWAFSNRVPMQEAWLGGRFGGWLEGNAVVSPQGGLLNVLRVDHRPEGGKAAVIRISRDGQQATFDPDAGFIEFPGGCKKFTIRFDAGSGRYWSLANWVPPVHAGENPALVRNTLALVSSPDARHWSVRSVVLYHPDPTAHAFQYVDWIFEGEDLLAVSRTAYDDGLGGAHNQHDANYITFHRVENFRSRQEAPEVLRPAIDRQARPKVLILGDSISIGYLPYVRDEIGLGADVVRPMSAAGQAENCAGTTKGLEKLESWLAMEPWGWDVIHFNFGLHDLKRIHPQSGANSDNRDHPRQAEPENYASQLRQIVRRLKSTGASLIFATTTPVPEGGVRPYRDVSDPGRYNALASEIMAEEGVIVNDLYELALPRLREWQRPVNVHFGADGSKALGQAVAREILQAVGRPDPR